MIDSHVRGIYKSRSGPYICGMITVGIVEDDHEVRDGIQEFCNSQPDLSCDLAEGSAEAFLGKLTPETIPDVILMDIALPGMSGIHATRLIKERFPDVDVLMLTVYIEPAKVLESLCAGASGYILKTTPFQQIRDSIKIVRAGGAPMSPPIAREVIEHFHSEHATLARSPMTAKEREVIIGLVDGLSYKMIAERLGVTIETVRSHIKNIYRKLHVHGKAEVIRKNLRGEV